jgi:succinate-acetate transporter protein
MKPLTEQEIIAEFQRRRARTGEKLQFWVIFTFFAFFGGILSVIGLAIARIDPGLLVVLLVVLMIPAATGIVVINLGLKRGYTCPACGRIPFTGGSSGGVLPDPDACPHCGVRLK